MTSLTAAQAIRMAIESQGAAAQYYAFLAERVDDATTRKFLHAMAELQRHQGQDLEAMEPVLFGRSSSPEANRRVRVEEPTPKWTCNEGEGVAESMALARRSERQEALFYDSLADQLPAPGSGFLRLLARSRECYSDMLSQAARDMEFRSQRSFTFHGAIRSAIQAEHACEGVYRGLMARARNPRTRAFLESMVRFEQAHVQELEKLSAGLPDERPVRSAGRVVIAKVAPLFRYSERIDLNDALQIAYDSEARASRYYAALAAQFSGKAAKLFLQLSRTEEQHAAAIGQTMQGIAA